MKPRDVDLARHVQALSQVGETAPADDADGGIRLRRKRSEQPDDPLFGIDRVWIRLERTQRAVEVEEEQQVAAGAAFHNPRDRLGNVHTPIFTQPGRNAVA